MKRHIFFIGTLRNGGAERVVSILASKMAEKGIAAEILMYYDKPIFYEVSSKIKLTVVEKETGTKSKVKNLFWLRKYFKNNAKIVISFLAPFNMMAIMANLGNGTPIIVADRNDPRKVPSKVFIRKMRDFLYCFANGIVVQTQRNKEYFGKTVQKKSTIIYNPVDLKEKTGIALRTPKEKKIVTAGRLMPQKNQKMMIYAFAELLKKYPNYQLDIYGDGPSETELKALINELKISESILLPGNVKDLHDRIKSAEVFILSSDYEGMPNALIEAMCLGLPVVSTKVSGATDLIRHGENGFLTDCGDYEQLEKTLDELLANPEKMELFANEGVKLAKALEVNVILKEWMDYIDEIVAKKIFT